MNLRPRPDLPTALNRRDPIPGRRPAERRRSLERSQGLGQRWSRRPDSPASDREPSRRCPAGPPPRRAFGPVDRRRGPAPSFPRGVRRKGLHPRAFGRGENRRPPFPGRAQPWYHEIPFEQMLSGGRPGQSSSLPELRNLDDFTGETVENETGQVETDRLTR